MSIALFASRWSFQNPALPTNIVARFANDNMMCPHQVEVARHTGHM